MTRSVKIFAAACCFTTGCILTGISGDMPFDISWLNPICLSAGFLLTMAAGLYGFLKLIRPLLYSEPILKNERISSVHPHSKY